jgi:formylglycine-generating enzyme required for sulfatase activity
MSGNVWEWTWDRYDSEYYRSSTMTDPQGPSNGSNRVFRGGSWDHRAGLTRVSRRDRGSPDFRFSSLGFRLVRSTL